MKLDINKASLLCSSFGSKHVTPRTLMSRFLGNMVCVEGIVTKSKFLQFGNHFKSYESIVLFVCNTYWLATVTMYILPPSSVKRKFSTYVFNTEIVLVVEVIR